MKVNRTGKRMNEKSFTLTNEEVEALYDYFMKRARYVSYEFDPYIILLIKKLAAYIEEF
jgi:hypothetical protein